MMRVASLLFCLVGIISAESGFRPKQQYEYKYVGKMVSGIPDVGNQWSAMGIKARVLVQGITENVLSVKITNFQEGEVESKRVEKQWTEDFPVDYAPVSKYSQYLEQPVRVYLQGGQVERMEVGEQEPETVVNLKKALISLLQVNLQQQRSMNMEDANSISRSSQAKQIRVRESGIGGDCETTYEISSVPKFLQISALGLGELESSQSSQDWSSESSSEDWPSSKKRFYVTKTKDYDNCQQSPIYRAATPYNVQCDPDKSPCQCLPGQSDCKCQKEQSQSQSQTNCQKQNYVDRSSVTQYVLSGDRSDFRIEKVVSQGEALIHPLGHRSEKLWSASNQTLQLVRESSISSPFPKPSSPRSLRSLVYQYPTEQSQRHQQEQEGKLPMPQLQIPPPVPVAFPGAPIEEIRRHLSGSALKEKAQSILQKITSALKGRTSEQQEATVGNWQLELQKVLSLMEYRDIKSLIREASRREQEEGFSKSVLADCLAMCGTNPAIMALKDLIESGSFSTARTVQLLAVLPLHIKTPTPQILDKIFELIHSSTVQQKKVIKANAALAFSNILYQACINKDVSRQTYPENLYGSFCSPQMSQIAQQYIPYIARQLEEVEEPQKPAYIQALGNIAHEEVIPILREYIQGQKSKSDHVRTAAIMALRRIASMRPVQAQKLCAPLFHDKAEQDQVRIAAFSCYIWSNPPLSSVQKLAISTWNDPSEQVVSFVYSSLQQLAQHTVVQMPRYFTLARKAQIVLPLVRPPPQGMSYSKSYLMSGISDQQQAGISQKVSWYGNAKSVIPSIVQTQQLHFLDGYAYHPYKMTAFLNGLQRIVDKLTRPEWEGEGSWRQSPRDLRPSSTLAEIRQQLGIRMKQSEKTSNSFYAEIMEAISLYQWADESDYDSLIEQLQQQSMMKSAQNIQKSFNLQDTTTTFPSELGLAITQSTNMPLVVSFQGQVKMETEPSHNSIVPSKIKLIARQFHPKFAFSHIPMFKFVSPFTLKQLGAGVDQSWFMSLPLSGEIEIDTKKQTASVELTVSRQSRTQLAKISTRPFTTSGQQTEFSPLSLEPNQKVIHQTQPNQSQWTIGQSLGLEIKVSRKSDYAFYDFASYYYEMMSQKAAMNAAGFWLAPSSLKYSETELWVNPSEWETQKFTALFSYHNAEQAEESESYMDDSSYGSSSESYENELKDVESQLDWSAPKYVHDAISRLSKKHHRKLSRETMLQGKDSQTSSATLSASFTGRSSRHLHANVYFSSSYDEQQQQQQVKADWHWVQQDQSPFRMCLKTELRVPQLTFKSRSEILNQDIRGRYQMEAEWGATCNGEKSIKVEGDYETTYEAKQYAMSSKEARACQSDESRGFEHSSVCQKAKAQAATIDKFDARIVGTNIPASLKNNASKVDTFVKYMLYPYLYDEATSGHGQQNQVIIQAWYHLNSSSLDIEVKKPYEKSQYKNIRLPTALSTTSTSWLLDDYSQKVAKIWTGEDKTSCDVDKEYIRTFDNVTIKHRLPNCYTALAQSCDASGTSRFGVMAKQEGELKSVKILIGSSELEMKTESSRSVKLYWNGRLLPLQLYKPYNIRVQNYIVASIVKINDATYHIRLPYFVSIVDMTPYHIHLELDQLRFKDKICGVCGDMNGEKTSDLMDPRGCIQTSAAKFVQSWATGHCRTSTDEEECIRKPRYYQ